MIAVLDPVAARPAPRQIVGPAEPVRFGAGQQWLAGLYQPAVGDGGGTAVLFCSPFGQEAIRSHRAFRIIAERLAREGIASLRFDYYGAGDSAGDDGDGRLALWRQNIRLADQRLRRLAGVDRVVWLGLRLGASLALQTTAELQARSQPCPARLLLWDPVIDGPDYLQHLSRTHEAWTRQRGVTDEALGFLLPAELRAEIAALSPDTLNAGSVPVAPEIAVDLMIADPIPGRDALLSRLKATGIPASCTIDPEPCEWSSNEAVAARWVPTPLISRLLDVIRAPR